MKARNTDNGYGFVAILVHWVFALVFFGLFGLGLYMVDLGYYDPWYRQGPDLHRSVGMALAFLLVFRLAWKLAGTRPRPEPGQRAWELMGAEAAHWALYLLPALLVVSGYLISTADGRAVSVFGWFDVPAVLPPEKGREDIAGLVHEILAWTAVAVAALHAAAALKHHFLDRDRTLGRMLRPVDNDKGDTPS